MTDKSSPVASLSLSTGNWTTPSGTTTTSERLLPQETALMTAYYTLLMALSVVSNGTIGVVFYKKPQLLTVSNNFVLNLACCDIGMSHVY